MKGIIWRVIPVLLIVLMLSHVTYYLVTNSGEIIKSRKIYITRLKIKEIQKEIKKIYKESQKASEIKKKLDMFFKNSPDISKDSWNNFFKIKRLTSDSWLIISNGPDKKFGTKDDIKSIFKVSRM